MSIALDLSGQRVMVTAGASGIGLAIARRFLAAGARVRIADLSRDFLDRALAAHPGLRGSVCDVSDEAQVGSMYDEAVAELGGLDVLVNNAGIAGPSAQVERIGLADWNRTLAVNLTGVFLCTRSAVPAMKAQRSGCILNIGTTSVRTGLPGRLAYVASKAAVVGMTGTLARELGPHDIRCNALLPGAVAGERGRAVLSRVAADQQISEAQAEEALLRHISMRTWVEPEEIGDLAVFLASVAGRHISGQVVSVCGNVEWE